jgi:phage terminase large subunit-like protein
MKRITFLGLHAQIAELGLAGKIDHEKHIPFEYQRGSVKQRRELLAGLLDTDGTCSNEGQVSYSTVSEQLSKDITELARSLGYLVRKSLIRRNNKKPLYRVYIRGNVNPFILPRKRALFKVPDKRSDRTALISIERIENEPSQCIRVEDDVHEFITDSYLATHNTRENGSRPVLALLDDLISDSDARSPTIIADVEDTVYNAIDHALNPNKRKIIWSGTPFNAKDPLYKAVESGAWNVNVYPVCEKFPCEREEFKGSWPDRFTYDYVSALYVKAKRSGKLASFNQELMLRIMSDDERLILDSDIQWYSRNKLMQQREYFNFYITTDFATSDKQSADFSVISVWAVNSAGHFFWVDGICKKQTMDKNITDLLRLVEMYKPITVGVEVTGQQGGFIPYLQDQMMKYRTFFAFASDNNGNKPGIRPTTNKHQRFNIVLPYFKQYMVHFPHELKDEPIMLEAMNELSLICADSFKSKHDDFIDTISMLGSMQIARPSNEGNSLTSKNDRYWEDEDEEENLGGTSNYVV